MSGIDTKDARRIAALMDDEHGLTRLASEGVTGAYVARLLDAMADAIDDLCGPREATRRPIVDDVDERGPTVAERLMRYRCAALNALVGHMAEDKTAEIAERLAHAMLAAERPVTP